MYTLRIVHRELVNGKRNGVEVPLSALAQVAAYFVHPEAAAAVATGCCLLLVRALAMPLPLHLPERACRLVCGWLAALPSLARRLRRRGRETGAGYAPPGYLPVGAWPPPEE